MKKALATVTLVCLTASATLAQPRGGPQARQAVEPPQQTQPPGNAQPIQANLNLIIEQIQKAALSTNGDLGKLRIEKWKTDNEQRDQLQKMADSIQRNVTYAIPGLINDVEKQPGQHGCHFQAVSQHNHCLRVPHIADGCLAGYWANARNTHPWPDDACRPRHCPAESFHLYRTNGFADRKQETVSRGA